MIETIQKPDTKPTPIKPQVWGCVYWIDEEQITPGESLTKVGPGEYMSDKRFPTEELVDEHGLRWQDHCMSCFLKFLFGQVKYLRAERLE